jgi:hypothetical protein
MSEIAGGLHGFRICHQEKSEAEENVFFMISYEPQIVGIAFDMSKSERSRPFYDKLHEACKIVLIQSVKKIFKLGQNIVLE